MSALEPGPNEFEDHRKALESVREMSSCRMSYSGAKGVRDRNRAHPARRH